MANFLDPAKLNSVELSDSSIELEGHAAPSLGGSSSSAEQVASESSPSEAQRSKRVCSIAEQLASETSPCERGRNKCSCCKKRKFDKNWTPDIIEECMGEIVEAIDEFRELYQTMESSKWYSKSLKWYCKSLPQNDTLQRIAKMNEEKEERLQKFMVEQQVVIAKMNEDKEERLQKLMVEQQVVMAKLITDAVKDVVGRHLDSPAE